MTPYERKEFNADFIAWLIVMVIFVFILIVYQTAYSYANQSTSTDYLPEQIRMLGLGCPACHLVKQPPNECGEFTGWLWEECEDMVHRYPDGDRQ